MSKGTGVCAVLNQANKEIFLSKVCPSLVHSFDDRYFIGANGSKVYDHKYDKVLLLIPELTMEHLVTGDNIQKMYDIIASKDSLGTALMQLTNKLRVLYKEGKYPFTPAEDASRLQELSLPLSSHLVKFGPGLQYPSSLLQPVTGGMPGSAEYAKSYAEVERSYNQGYMVRPFECEVVMQAQHALELVLTKALHEFREQVLVPMYYGFPAGSSSSSSSSIDTSTCTKCGKSTDLKHCGKCQTIRYCSR
jgi:hypothetical protein